MKNAFAAIVFAACLSACGGASDGGESSKQQTPSTAPTVDPFAPNLGDRALKVGSPREGMSIKTTLLEIKQPYPYAEDFRTPDNGGEYVGLNIEQCLSAKETDQYSTTYNGEWALVTPDGDEFAGSGEHWNDWPAPKFPESKTLIPDRCRKGWLVIEAPKNTEIESVLWSPDGSTIAEWVR